VVAVSLVNIVGDVPVDKIATLEHHFTRGDREPEKPKQKKENKHEE
jgi:hypothetical protein